MRNLFRLPRRSNNPFHARLSALLVSMAAALLLGACLPRQTVYHHYESLPAEGWHTGDTLRFETQVPDSQVYCRLNVEVRNRNDYPYRNLPLRIACLTADSLQLPPDTLDIFLANDDGGWLGTGLGNYYQLSQFVGSVHIRKPGTYTFQITCLLPDTVVTGINDIGIRLER